MATTHPARVYREFDHAELAVAYSPSSCIEDLSGELAGYARHSAASRARLTVHRDLRYGPEEPELLDFFPAPGPDAPLQVFVHGGYWQELGKSDSAFAAPDFVDRGAAFAAVGYGLAPAHSLDDIVAMVRRAVRWLAANAASLGVDPDRIHLSGSSAGAHLAVMALLDPEGAAAGRIAGAALLSGVYDLEPIRLTYVNDALGLDAAGAYRNSPLHHLRPDLPPLVIARGGNETGEYGRQHEDFAEVARRMGAPVVSLVEPERHHFDLPYDLGRPESRLGAAVLTQMGLPLRAPGRSSVASAIGHGG
ncbi:alpha/beta hydrolase [Streptomyces rubellomurinus]|uniref:alpha/beta hydrolase n=1 Tax=Streptomyces rubellomurinus (strain ATCC 31215) TaxID=359131 RepID=UPI0005F0CA6B|nr:alpha/beta hydrolase [Streptomyces rubellomurinus]